MFLGFPQFLSHDSDPLKNPQKGLFWSRNWRPLRVEIPTQVRNLERCRRWSAPDTSCRKEEVGWVKNCISGFATLRSWMGILVEVKNFLLFFEPDATACLNWRVGWRFEYFERFLPITWTTPSWDLHVHPIQKANIHGKDGDMFGTSLFWFVIQRNRPIQNKTTIMPFIPFLPMRRFWGLFVAQPFI